MKIPRSGNLLGPAVRARKPLREWAPQAFWQT